MAMKVGIVGMPNAGKSSLFNALTKAGAEAANYPFTTIEPNVAVVPVPDQRLLETAAVTGATDIRLDQIHVHDIAGLVRGASKGEGLGNQFLANIRETDAILHVVRAHEDAGVVHPEGEVNPLRDIETIETELIYADLEQAERRLERVAKQAKSLDPEAVAEETWLKDVVAALQAGSPVRSVPAPEDAPLALKSLSPLTGKPVLFVANVTEGEIAVPDVVTEHAQKQGAEAVAISSRLEAELVEMSDAEAAIMREELGLPESGLATVIKGAFKLLDLITFFTVGEEIAQSWHMKDGGTVYAAAGEIHTDIQQGFVRAEVINFQELIDCGGYAGAREKGLLRVEGREYMMRDGDVITVKHTN
jgi:GTP-binding protein YchF